jgi:hypothetical protein
VAAKENYSMSISTRPNGTTVREVDGMGGANFLDLGTGTAAQIIAVLAAIPIAERQANTFIMDITDGNPVVLTLPLRPVGFDLILVVDGGNVATALTVNELDGTGFARAVSARTGGGAALAFDAVGLSTKGATADFENTFIAGVLTFTGNVGVQCIHLKKIRPSSTNLLSDGWILMSITNQDPV